MCDTGMSESERAYERALSCLERRDMTEYELTRKLAEAGFSTEAAGAALDRLREAGLVNDIDYAARYLETLLAKGRGRLRITAEMRRKGLPEELVRNAVDDGYTAEVERRTAAEAAKRFFAEMPKETESRKAAAKVNRRLVSLGFSYDVIGSVMRDIRVESKDEDEGVLN